jgi:hypothetical protein
MKVRPRSALTLASLSRLAETGEGKVLSGVREKMGKRTN